MEGEAEVQNQKPRGLGFMDLPFEIRQQIYRLCVPTRTVLFIGKKPTCAAFRYGFHDADEDSETEEDPRWSSAAMSEAEEVSRMSDAAESDDEESDDEESDAGDITDDGQSDAEESGDGDITDDGEPFTSNTEEPTSDVEEAEPWDDRPDTVVETPPQKRVSLSCPLDSWADDWSRTAFPQIERAQKAAIHNLCAVSPQIESELLDVFYGENLWFVDLLAEPRSPEYPDGLAKHIRQEHRSKIRHLLVEACLHSTIDPDFRPGLRRKTWENVFPNIRTLRILAQPPACAQPPHHSSCSRALADLTTVCYFEVLRKTLGVIGETLNPSATVLAEIMHASEETCDFIRKLLPRGYLPTKTAYSEHEAYYNHGVDDDRSCGCYSSPEMFPKPTLPCFLDPESEDVYDDSYNHDSPNRPNESAPDQVSEHGTNHDTDSDSNHDLGQTELGIW